MDPTKKLLIISRYDSFIKASIPVRDYFVSHGYDCDYYIVTDKGFIDRDHLTEVGFESKFRHGPVSQLLDLERLRTYQAVMLSLEGNDIYQFLAGMRALWPEDLKRPVVFGGYCGIVYERFFQGAMLRQALDVFFVNSKYDAENFTRLLSEIGVKDCRNICVTGLPLLDLSYTENKPEMLQGGFKNIVFAGQPTVPESLAERTCVASAFVDYCHRFPDHTVYFKPRHKPNQDSVHKTLFHYQRIFEKLSKKKALPKNLIVTYDPIVSLMDKADLCLTVSSTAAFEAFNKGVAVGFLMDFGIREDYGTSYFAGSGCATSFKELMDGLSLTPNIDWWNDRFLADGQNAQRLFDAVDCLVEKQLTMETSLPFQFSYKQKYSAYYEAFAQANPDIDYRKKTTGYLLKIYYFLKSKGVLE